jgi:hypothetical protein
VEGYLAQHLPTLDTQVLRTARGTVGVIAFVSLPITGWFWVDAMRSSIRKVWGLPEYPGTLVVRLLVDLLVLAGLGILLVVSSRQRSPPLPWPTVCSTRPARTPPSNGGCWPPSASRWASA